jgi:T5SS/PEP-CTERM-associated repeat protein/autotransporter-associated beta strand protein
MPFFKSRKSRSVRLLSLIVVALLFAATAPVDLRADTTLDSGTTTVTTGTDFGGNLYVGFSGTATLEVLVGGSAANVDAEIGFNAGSQGTVTIAGGTWTNSGSLFVGDMGAGTLNLSDGRVSNTDGYLAALDGSSGTATVSGGTWTNSNYLIVGVFGTGVMNLSGGTVINEGSGIIGDWAGSRGSVAVSGGTWASADLIVGSSGTGTLSITGGSVTSGFIYVGNAIFGAPSSGVGIATVTGGTWANAGDLYLGYDSVGTLNVNGGYVSNASGTIGVANGSNGTATVSSGTWANSGDLLVGESGTGTLTMTGGLFSVAGTLSKGTFGTINLNSGGTLQIGTGGTTGVLGVSTLTNNGTLIFNRSDAATYSGVLSGSGAVIKDGGGVLTLSGSSGLTGPTTIREGVLHLANAAAISSSEVTPLAGGTLTLAPYINTTVGGLSPNAGGLIDVGNGMVTVAIGLSVPDLTAALVRGYSNGSWTSTGGITSSTVAEDVLQNIPRAVGWLEAGNGSTRFGYAATADTNLDGIVDVVDVANVVGAGKFDTGQTSSWIQGDFNYDGIVDVLDVAAFNATDLFDKGPYNSSPLQLTIAVPEPSTYAMALAGIACGGYSMFRRRRVR